MLKYGVIVLALVNAIHGNVGASDRKTPPAWTKPCQVNFVDSCPNQYGFFTPIQDPIKGEDGIVVLAYNRLGDGATGGALALAWTVDNGCSWSFDWPVNDGLVNDPNPGIYAARAPSACIHPEFPAAAWPEVPSFAVGNEIDWSNPGFYGAFSPESLEIARVWVWARLSDGMLVGLAQDITENLYFFSYDPLQGDFENPGTLLSELGGLSAYWLDYRPGPWPDSFMVGGYSSELGGLAYATSPDCETWSSPRLLSSPSMPTLWVLHSLDGAIGMDSIYPMMVLDIDVPGTHEQANQVWFVRPDTAVRIDPGLDTYNHNAQISMTLDGQQTLTVFWCEATTEEYDLEIEGWWHDIYCARSENYGYTWSNAMNVTGTPDVNECLVHVARYSSSYCWLTASDGSQGDLYWGVISGGQFDNYPSMLSVYVPTSVQERGKPQTYPSLDMLVTNNPGQGEVEVRFSLPWPQNVTLTLYDVLGRPCLSKEGMFGEGPHVLTFDVYDMESGIYFIRLKGEFFRAVRKCVILN